MMMSTITTPGALELAGFLGCLFFVVAGANAILKLTDRFKDKPPASEVRLESADKFTSKGEFKDHVVLDLQEHSNLWSKIGGLERGLQKDIKDMELRLNASDEQRSSALHDRVNEILAAVSELSGRINKR
jgi:hypothetical protein